MPLRDSLPNVLIDNIVDLLRLRANAGSEHKDLQSWADKMLDAACRHIEYFVEPEVSVEAAARWKANGGTGDLRAQRNRKTSGWKRGAGLHFEHAVPVLQLRDDLIALGAHPTASSVRVILETAEVAWITTEQKKDIPEGRRDNWRAFYDKIALAPKS
jgi:hypothetical protein